jgi:metallo-beta-lactamase family protein
VSGDAAAAPTLQFLGGAGTVTGSKYLVRTDGATVLVDCGLFQGLRELRERNWDAPPFDPAGIDAVVVTHAHVDHCGYLPRLVAAGYRGPVFMTPATAELAAIVLPDCAHLLEEEASYANRKGFSKHHPALPLYTQDDAWRALDLVETVPTGTDWDPAPNVAAEYVPAGHILGAASVRLRAGAEGPTVGFSGDLGRNNHPFLVGPQPIGDVDVLLVESTYGDRIHEAGDPSDALAATINRTLDRGGSVLIPAFAVDRTEVVLHHLARLVRAGRIPRGVPVYVDSPMALSALAVYRRAFDRHDPDIRAGVGSADHQFAVPGLREVREVEESKALNQPHAPSIVVSASGMATGGRVVHHLAHWLPDARNTVLLVGYQAQGTRGRKLLDGVSELKMLGRYVPVRAEIVDFSQFSVHADAAELLDWVAAASQPPDTVYVVHGEPAASAALARNVRDKLGWTAVVPRHGERVRLDRWS